MNVPYLNVIQTLDLSRVGKLTLTDAGFRDYESLKSLDICKTETTALKSSWFSRKNIEVLNVSENLIKGLKKDDMKFFSRLRIFNASFNEIKTLEANTFLESKKLEVISLSNNELINVAFDNLENLKQLFLRDNSIVTVSFTVTWELLNWWNFTDLGSDVLPNASIRNFASRWKRHHRNRRSKLFHTRKPEISQLEQQQDPAPWTLVVCWRI